MKKIVKRDTSQTSRINLNNVEVKAEISKLGFVNMQTLLDRLLNIYTIDISSASGTIHYGGIVNAKSFIDTVNSIRNDA